MLTESTGPTPVELLEYSFSNVAASLRGVVMDDGGLAPYFGNHDAVLRTLMRNMNITLAGAELRLTCLAAEFAEAGREMVALAERVEARTIIWSLKEWSLVALLMSNAEIDGVPNTAPFKMPEHVRSQVLRLAAIGRLLAATWQELVDSRVTLVRIERPEMNAPVPDIDTLPQYRPGCAEWIPAPRLAASLSITTASLGNTRAGNETSPDGLVHRDAKRRLWIKKGRFTFYLKSSLAAWS